MRQLSLMHVNEGYPSLRARDGSFALFCQFLCYPVHFPFIAGMRPQNSLYYSKNLHCQISLTLDKAIPFVRGGRKATDLKGSRWPSCRQMHRRHARPFSFNGAWERPHQELADCLLRIVAGQGWRTGIPPGGVRVCAFGLSDMPRGTEDRTLLNLTMHLGCGTASGNQAGSYVNDS